MSSIKKFNNSVFSEYLDEAVTFPCLQTSLLLKTSPGKPKAVYPNPSHAFNSKSYRLESLRSSVCNCRIKIATSLFAFIVFCIVNSKHLCGFIFDIFDNGIVLIQTEFFPPFRITL